MTAAPSRALRTLLPTFLLALLFAAPRAHAQAPIEPGQLPARTSFYVVWRGEPSGDLRKASVQGFSSSRKSMLRCSTRCGR